VGHVRGAEHLGNRRRGRRGPGKRIAELARKTGVEHYVYTSVGSAHRTTGIPHFDNKWRIEETVRGLGFPSHIILRPVFFMDNVLSPWFKPGIDQGKLIIGLKPTTVLQMIAVRDIGKYGLLAFETAEALNRKEIDLAGDAHTMPQAAQILSKAAGRSITFQPVPLEDVRKASEDYALMLEWFDRVGYDADIPGNAKRYGIKPTTLANGRRASAGPSEASGPSSASARSRPGWPPRGRRGHRRPTAFEGAQGRWSSREPQGLDCGHAQLARLPPEKSTGRLRPLDERLHRVGAPDPAQREDQLAHHRLVLLLFHRDHEGHRQRAGLAPADPDGHLHAHFLRAVAQRAA